jgi:hypothetical protein
MNRTLVAKAGDPVRRDLLGQITDALEYWITRLPRLMTAMSAF